MDQELIEYLERRFAELRTEVRAAIDARAAETRRYVDMTVAATRRYFEVVTEGLMDEDPGRRQRRPDDGPEDRATCQRDAWQLPDGGTALPPHSDASHRPTRFRIEAAAQGPADRLDRALDELRMAIRDAAAKTSSHIDPLGDRLKPGRFLRYLEARAAEIADRTAGEATKPGFEPLRRSVVYAVPPHGTARDPR